MVILAIESSHDDTSLALMKDGKPIWMETITQIEVHKNMVVQFLKLHQDYMLKILVF